MLCKIDTFNEAIELALNLLTEDFFKKKNLKGEKLESSPIKNLICFLTFIRDNIKDKKVEDYSKLMIVISNTTNKDTFPLLGYLGKILDGIQLLKRNSYRYINAIECFKNNLQRTSHDFILNNFPKETLDKLYVEITTSSSLYVLLEACHLAYNSSENPINSLRRSMGDRLPEEYFSELLSGWAIEYYFLNLLKNKGVEAEKIGTDHEFTIKFQRPKDMGEADIRVKINKVFYSIELQRVGKATSKDRIFKTFLKEHKKKAISENWVIILWVGKNPKNIKNSNKILHDKIIFIKSTNIEKVDHLKWAKEYIFFDENYLREYSIGGIENLSKDNFELMLKH